MQYPEIMIRPMREELTRLGVEELRTPEQVDETIKNSKGTLMVVVNSICGCAAGKARPGVALALEHEIADVGDPLAVRHASSRSGLSNRKKLLGRPSLRSSW